MARVDGYELASAVLTGTPEEPTVGIWLAGISAVTSVALSSVAVSGGALDVSVEGEATSAPLMIGVELSPTVIATDGVRLFNTGVCAQTAGTNPRITRKATVDQSRNDRVLCI